MQGHWPEFIVREASHVWQELAEIQALHFLLQSAQYFPLLYVPSGQGGVHVRSFHILPAVQLIHPDEIKVIVAQGAVPVVVKVPVLE